MFPFLERKDAGDFFDIFTSGSLEDYIGPHQNDIFKVEANSRCLPQKTMRVCVVLNLEQHSLFFEADNTVFTVKPEVVIYFESPTLKNFGNFRLLLRKKLELGSESEPKIAFAIPCINKGHKIFLKKTSGSQNLWIETPYFFRGPPPDPFADQNKGEVEQCPLVDMWSLSQLSIPTMNTQGASPVPYDDDSDDQILDDFEEIGCPTNLEMYWGRQSPLQKGISLTKKLFQAMKKQDQELEKQRAEKPDVFLGN